VSAIVNHIKSLERYAERRGARVVRARLPPSVHGGVAQDLITLQSDLEPEQELVTLVHEMTHWLAHRDPHAQGARCTIYEYEAEAVEALVMARLGLAPQAASDLLDQRPTDGLLPGSVHRVLATTQHICQVLGLEPT
jgi:hypothetical protein